MHKWWFLFFFPFVILEELDNEKYILTIEKQRMTKNSKPSIILLILEIMLYQQCMLCVKPGAYYVLFSFLASIKIFQPFSLKI